jgi:Na+/H+ antiporter NhaD/arsenite permease-like protein
MFKSIIPAVLATVFFVATDSMVSAISNTKNIVQSDQFTLDFKLDYDVAYKLDLPSVLGNFNWDTSVN